MSTTHPSFVPSFVPLDWAMDDALRTGIGMIQLSSCGGLLRHIPPSQARGKEVYRWMPHLGGWVYRGVRR